MHQALTRIVCTRDTHSHMIQTTWRDPEDALLFEAAKALMADAIITNNAKDFETDAIPVLNSAEFFAWLKEVEGLSYALAEE